MLGIIINPKSGKKAFLRQRYYLFELLEQKQIEYVYRVTKYAGHATELARELAEQGVRDFLILGGDGTISEAVNGLMKAEVDDRENIRFGIMPRGTGNDFARFWNLDKNYRKSLDRFFSGKPQPIDVGCLTYHRNGDECRRYFINSVGFGVDSKTLALTHVLKYYFGSHRLLYVIALIVAVCRHKSQMLCLSTDRGLEVADKLFTMNIGNGPFSGGGIRQNPTADPRDGFFNAMFIKTPTLKQILQAVPHIFDGKLMDLDFVHKYEAEKVVMDVPDVDSSKHCGQKLNVLPFEADGILVEACTPFVVECLPHALQIIC